MANKHLKEFIPDILYNLIFDGTDILHPLDLLIQYRQTLGCVGENITQKN